MPLLLRFFSWRVAVLLALLVVARPTFAADKKDQKAREAEAKRLMNLGRAAEKQDNLLEARRQFLASEDVLFNDDAEQGLERIAKDASKQVKTLMGDAEKAYAAENFAKAAELLERASALYPGNLGIGCNLALTKYQQGNRDDVLPLLDQCVGALRDNEPRRQLAELYTALATGDRTSVVAPAARPQIARLNDAILQDRDNDPVSDNDDEGDAPAAPAATLCAQMKQLQTGLLKNPAMLWNLAKCAESEGRLADAIRLLAEYGQAAPTAADGDDVQAQLVVLKALVALPDPNGTLVRTLYASARKHIESRGYDLAIADYQKAAEAMPQFAESKRRVASLLEAQGLIDLARTNWQQAILADTVEERRGETQLIVDGLATEATQYNELVGAARRLLDGLMTRSLLEGQPVGQIWAAYQLQLANDKLQSAAILFPLGAEGNLLRAFTCQQVNDFRCVRASFDAQRSLMLPVSFYAAVFYKGVQPDQRWKEPRVYGKFEFDKGTVRFAQISTVSPKKGAAAIASPVAGEDRLGRLGAPTGMRTGSFLGFTVPSTAIKHLENQAGLMYMEVDDKRIKQRKMLIEPLSFVITFPAGGPGARRYLNNYISIAETYGGVEKAKLGKEATTLGEKLKTVYNIASIGMDVTSLMFGDFSAIVTIAGDVNRLGKGVALNQRQAQRLATTRRQAIQGSAFKAIPTEVARLTFRKDLQ